MTALAFRPDYAGTWLRAMFASDLGHWDVPDACGSPPRGVGAAVERGHVTADDFKALLRVTDGEPGCVALVEPGPGMS